MTPETETQCKTKQKNENTANRKITTYIQREETWKTADAEAGWIHVMDGWRDGEGGQKHCRRVGGVVWSQETTFKGALRHLQYDLQPERISSSHTHRTQHLEVRTLSSSLPSVSF